MSNSELPIEIKTYLYEISERLWSNHAAVMIGSGFSRNAVKNDYTKKDLPTWNQLGDILYEKLYRSRPSKDQRYLNILKLADEVQAAFGRPTLDHLVRESIPDKDFEPSTLHVDMLELPWADIFTTNYDTLLERACESVISQKYDIVINQEDLMYAQKPRIVKLHGSFPSERPLIVSEEDYRRYPTDFAPFVNTVQQALLENTLVLIGFSADDPNFLQWIGWIRDNLGKNNSPKIYLVGLLNISDAQKRLLESKNIVLVNMLPSLEDENNHSYALQIVIDFLKKEGRKKSKFELAERIEEWKTRHKEHKGHYRQVANDA